jgi:hypothetical protein
VKNDGAKQQHREIQRFRNLAAESCNPVGSWEFLALRGRSLASSSRAESRCKGT